MLSLSDVASSTWDITARVEDLPLAERFTIARGSWDAARNVFVTVSHGGVKGFGEVSPDEDPEAVVEQIGEVDLDRLGGPFDLEGILLLLPAGAARCALDIALHDLAGKLAGRSLGDLLGVEGRAAPPTSITLPIAEPDGMIERARGFVVHPILKMKVGFD